MQAGEAVLSPEILIEVALSQGELPTSQTCVRCGEVTDHTAFVWAELERAQIKRPSWTINPIGLLFGWLVLSRSGQVRVLGRDRAYRLPIRLCEDCCPLRRRELREAVAQEPLYRQLLDKYPPGAAVALQSMR